MSRRSRARETVLQVLYQDDMNPDQPEDIRLKFIHSRLNHDKALVAFAQKLLAGIHAHQAEVDQRLQEIARNWKLSRMANTDRNVLRLGAYEILFAETPDRVAINEAIELAKQFGGDNSSRFVNGVLGAVYKEIGEPGKDEQGTKRKKHVAFEDMPIQRLSGAVVYAEHEGQMYLALVHDIFGHWTLSKGKIEEGESVEQGAARELKEEIGLDITIEDELGNNEYVASHPELGKIRKQVHYFLASAPYTELVLEQKGGLDDAKWFKVAEILDLNFYEDILPIVTKAITMLVGRSGK